MLVKYHYFYSFFTYSMVRGWARVPHGSCCLGFWSWKTAGWPSRSEQLIRVEDSVRWEVWLGWHICQKITQVSQGENGNLARKKRVKASLIPIFSTNTNRKSMAYRSFGLLRVSSQRCQKIYHRDNWLVAAKRL